MCRSAGQRQRGRTARCWGVEGSGRRPAKRPQPPFCSDAASLQRGLFSPGKPETGKKKLAKPAVDSVSLPTLHLIQKPFAPASPRVGRAPPAVVTGVRVRTGPSRFNRPDARTVDSRYFFKDKRVREKMSEIKTLTLLSSPVACEGPRPVCGAGPRTPLGGQTCGLGRGESLLPSRLHAHRPSRETEANGPHLLVQPPAPAPRGEHCPVPRHHAPPPREKLRHRPQQGRAGGERQGVLTRHLRPPGGPAASPGTSVSPSAGGSGRHVPVPGSLTREHEQCVCAREAPGCGGRARHVAARRGFLEVPAVGQAGRAGGAGCWQRGVTNKGRFGNEGRKKPSLLSVSVICKDVPRMWGAQRPTSG